jgi:hypothetical protein
MEVREKLATLTTDVKQLKEQNGRLSDLGEALARLKAEDYKKPFERSWQFFSASILVLLVLIHAGGFVKFFGHAG